MRRAVAQLMTTGLVASALAVTAYASSAPAERGGEASGVVTSELSPVAAKKKRMVVIQQNTDAKKVTFDAVMAKAGSADAITLQEVCKSWVDAAKQASWTVAFTPTTKANKCDDGTKRKGVAVIIPKAVKRPSVKVFKLKKDIGRTPKLLCVNFTSKGIRSHVCSTHLVAFKKPIKDKPAQKADQIRRTQVTQIRNRTRKWMKQGNLVVVGGDFNAVPKAREMSAMYGGLFTEVSQLNGRGGRQGEETTDPGKKGGRRKIDYVFFSRNRVPIKNKGSVELIDHPEGHAGHWMMVATARVNK